MELVRSALAAGVEKPTDIVEHIKKQGVDINTGQVSNYKSLLKKEGPVSAKSSASANGRRGRKPGRKHQASAGTQTGNFAVAVTHIKQLCQQLGTDQVKQLADLFA